MVQWIGFWMVFFFLLKIIVVTVIVANAIAAAMRGTFHDVSPSCSVDLLGSPPGGVYGGIVSYDVFKPKLGSWLKVLLT